MHLHFLKADQPQTKTLYSNGQISQHPQVKNLTSEEKQVETLSEFLSALKIHALQGHCLLKGLLTQQIINESRAGLTDTHTQTNWLIIDYDREQGFDSIEHLLTELGPEFTETSYIFQHSAQAGVKYKAGLRGHIFFLLNKPELPSTLNNWINYKNLTIPNITSQVELSKNNLTLKYPLDISVNLNSKLIYIAPPICADFEDPIKNRFELVQKQNEHLSIDFSTNSELLQQHTLTKINELRKAIGLKPKKPVYRYEGDIGILTNPGPQKVTGFKCERGFAYLNLDHGDSWAYYFPENNIEIIHNFKNEPPVYLKDIDPEFYKTCKQQLQKALVGDKNETSAASPPAPLVCHDPEADTYHTGYYDRDKQELLAFYKTSGRQKLIDFMIGQNEPEPAYIPDWKVVFDPTTNKTIDPNANWINTFRKTKYLAATYQKINKVPKTIDLVLRSITVTEECYDRFLNWLAFIFQKRERAGTAWIFHGTTGTGKGTLFHEILTPLFGQKYSKIIGTKNLKDQYNSYLHNTLILFIDELKVKGKQLDQIEIINDLKTAISEKRIAIRKTYQNEIIVPNYTNIIITANERLPIPVQENDRRFNVAPRQEQTLPTNFSSRYNEVNNELDDFAAFLQHYEINDDLVRKPIITTSKEELIEASLTTVELFFRALSIGDFDYFTEATDLDETTLKSTKYLAYEKAIRRWASTLNDNPTKVTNQELLAVYNHLLNQTASLKIFAMLAKRHGFSYTHFKINGIKHRGIKVNFKRENPFQTHQHRPKVVQLHDR